MNALVAETLSWLNRPTPAFITKRTAGWDRAVWSQVETVLTMHGTAAFLSGQISKSEHNAQDLPDRFIQYLSEYQSANDERNRQMNADLQAILSAAHQRSLPIMPLKGSILANMYYEEPSHRPMADLDLLVRSEHLGGIDEILQSLAYKQLKPDNPTAKERHYRYLKPDNQEVVHWHLPSPDNPRPVEIHTSLARMLWGDTRLADMSEELWSRSRPGRLLDVPVLLPQEELVFSYVALHMLDHLMLQNGRGIQIVDLSTLADRGLSIHHALNPNWIYPALKLASRCMPDWWQDVDLGSIEPKVTKPIIEWAKAVPLDESCGLMVDPRPPSERRFFIHWERWRPSSWRLQIAHADTPLYAAFVKHMRTVLAHLVRRFSRAREIPLGPKQ